LQSRRKLVKTTRKLVKKEGDCIDCQKSTIELSLSQFSGLIKRKENYTKLLKKYLKKFLKFFFNSVTPPLAEPEEYLLPQNPRANQSQP